uniref:Alternative protein A2M n=1 Tax=Homo sapiens TaxID=9606 RepID=L0R6B6_HUMAN|nr:alternative protein A2M [Homo sapiens]
MPCFAWSQPGRQHKKGTMAAMYIPKHCWPMLLPWQVTRTRGRKYSSHLMRKL